MFRYIVIDKCLHLTYIANFAVALYNGQPVDQGSSEELTSLGRNSFSDHAEEVPPSFEEKVMTDIVKATYQHHVNQAKAYKAKLTELGDSDDFQTPELQIRSHHCMSPTPEKNVTKSPDAKAETLQVKATSESMAAPPSTQNMQAATSTAEAFVGSAKGKRGGFIAKLAAEDGVIYIYIYIYTHFQLFLSRPSRS
jgi:hypothetical protein